jgi:hypothetical protein
MDLVNALVAKLRAAPYKERESIKAEMLAALRGPDGKAFREALDGARRGELLEVQWEIEEVLEATAPPVTPPQAPPPPPAPEPPPQDPNRKLTAKDLTLVYDDPRGLLLHKSKVGERWFATQVDPRTRQPQTFELHPQEVEALKSQLAGSPYWVIGAGPVVAAAKPPLAGR